MSESGGFLKFNITLTSEKQMLSLWFFLTLCFMLEILQQTKEFNSDTIKYHNFEFKNWKKKHEKYQNLEGFFQILTHSNYKQTSGIQLEFFTQGLWWEYYSKPKN